MPENATIALLTDFGLADPYVGQMKSILDAQAPKAHLVDISHDVLPYSIVQGAFFLSASAPYLALGSIVVVVVDPGVGSERKIILLETDNNLILAPDNGVVSLLLNRQDAARVWDVTPDESPASSTFHGRDIFAPLAARLANGEPPENLGREMRLGELVQAAWSAPQLSGDTLIAQVLHVDRFGNSILNIPQDEWKSEAPRIAAILAGTATYPLFCTTNYSSIGQNKVGLVTGSQGYFELAMNQHSAASYLNLSPGDTVTLHLAP